jgi:RNA polymerase sigma-70 factor (ECF subfamily)
MNDIAVLPSNMEYTDESIIAKIRARDARALEALYERYASQAFALAYRVLAVREIAEEVTQDAFISVWRQAATYNARVGRVRPWLLSIVHHRAIDRIRRVRERRPLAQLDEAWMKASDADVFRDVYRSMRLEEIQRALRCLPREQGQAIELVYFGANSYVEISRMTAVPVGTVKSRVRLGLIKLRELIPEELAS